MIRTSKRLLLILGIAALAAGPACAPGEPTRDEDGDITETENVNPNLLKAGDCFNDPEAGTPTQVTELRAVPCEEPHDNEVFYVFDLEDGEFPGADEVKQAGLDACEPQASEYLGAEPEAAALVINPITPTEQSWVETKDRTVICALYKADGSEITGPLQDSGEDA